MDLSNYVRVAIYDLPEPTRTSAPANNLLAQEASAVTYNWDTNTLFVMGDGGTSIVQVSLTGQIIDTMTLAQGSSPQGTTFYDTEGLTYIGNGQFVFTEERWRQAVEFTYQAGTTLTRADAHTVDLGTDIGNVGLEGVTYDPLSGGFIFVKEKDPEGIFQTTIDFTNGTASNGSSTTVESTNLFDAAKVGTLDLSDVYALSSNATYLGTSEEGNLLILSQESGKVVEVDRAGNVLSTLDLVAPSTSSGIDIAAMTVEGITMDANGNIYLVSEQGGGDANHPQLWVYSPISTSPNEAPTAVSLTNPLGSILENTDTTARIKVADIAITDDGQGTNHLSLTGADAALFEVDTTGLYLKAGTVLNYEAKSSYAVTVNVDDTTVGNTPDVTTDYTLKVTNVVNEGAAGSVAITEVAPWGSGVAAVGSDWFELTNTGSTAIDLSGWKMDDNSYAFGSAVALSGVTSIAAGESVIFLEVGSGQTAAGVVSAFEAQWFGGNVPANLQIGTYSGSGVGLSTSGDAVAVFDSAGNLKASVTFGASPSNPLATFDNTAQLNSTSTTSHVTISTLSATGSNGAAAAANDASEIGSPGSAGGVPAPVNHAPTAIGLTGEITTLTDDTSTANHVKVASIIVNDDGLGTNNLSLSGTDAALFEVDSTGLYLKAGTTLDATVKAHYDVTVNVDDPTVGASPDASVSFALDLTHVAVVADQVRITEVAPWSSGNSPVGADWFEVTNTGSSAVDITGWKMDDNSNAFSNAVALNGVTSIAAGESVIFLEGSAATAQAFITNWFGGNVPAGLQVGYYSGSGVGLSTGGDAVNLYNASGVLQANVSFGSSPSSSLFGTFDNSAGLDNVALSATSTVGTNGAFTAANDSAEIGSPGRIAGAAAPINAAPTAVALANVTSAIEENTSTATHIKVADVVVTDDGLGTNTLSLSGADASFFEVDSTGLYIKAGTTLDYETKSSYAVTVNVDDTTVGGTPDASTNYTLHLTDVANEGGAASPQVRVTEVAPWSSSNSPFLADWFEVTNTGSTASNIGGWKMDDNSFSFSSAVALNGVSSIAAGESVIFVEGTAATAQAFISAWFGGNVPAGIQVGWYSGSGVGLSTSSDGVAIYDSTGNLQAKVSFGASPSGPFATFDNSAGLDNVTLTTLSSVGTNGAFHAAADAAETGSPGTTVTPNQAPVAADDVALALAEDNVLTSAGNAITNDSDTDALHVAGVRVGTEAAGGSFTMVSGATVVHGLYGDLTINQDGSYSYALNNGSAAVQALNDGEHVSDVFTYQVSDTHDATDVAQISFDIAGANDGPPVTYGTNGADTLNGTNNEDILNGLSGNDKLFGNGADDVLVGGEGRDVLNGGDGIDTVSYEYATSGIAADLGTAKGTYGEAIGDKFVSIENLTGSAFDDALYGDRYVNVLSGGDGNDYLEGAGGDDTLLGGKGNDIINGGKGVDQMSGGQGADTFMFIKGDTGKTADTADTILDFLSGVDKIDLTGIDAHAKTKDIVEDFTFIGNAAFHKVAGELHYEVDGSGLHLSGDWNGDGKADFMINFTGITSLTADDFVHLL
jgi:VCBS repeat-containing protein